MAGGVVLPLDVAGSAIEGVHIGPIVIDDAGHEVSDAVVYQDAAVDGPGGAHRAVHHDVALHRRAAELPQEPACRRFERVHVAISTADVSSSLPDGRGVLDGTGGAELPAESAVAGVQRADLAVITPREDESAGRGRCRRQVRTLRRVLPSTRHRCRH